MRTDFLTATQTVLGDPSEENGSQAVKVQLKLREMILAGELKAGSRITELALVEKLGVSRTPIRAALIRLEQEGLLQQMPSGGFAVRKFSEADVADAIELRGTVEGLAARLAAERGVASDVLVKINQSLNDIDLLLQAPVLDEEAFSRYVDLNAQFHVFMGALAASPVIQRELERVASLPFASPSGFVGVQANSPSARDMLIVAQDQHRQVMQAIGQREGARAEALMREHSRLAQRNLREAVQSPLHLPGAHLITPST
jgi:GntR family transcriptional regulator, vanillate catabolism transcriptional regulator